VKAIILAGGAGTRLHPLTHSISKQLLPVYNKPMIYYPLSVIMLAQIRDVLIISTPQDQPLFQRLLKDGSAWGINISYAIQQEPQGIAQAFIIGADFIAQEPVCLILGDNIFYGNHLASLLRNSLSLHQGATLFGYQVKDPQRYGVVEFNAEGKVIHIEEKPKEPKSNVAVTGLYMYDGDVVQKARKLTPSARRELEITDINNSYLKEGRVRVELMGRGMAWLDTGTFDSLLQAGQFVQVYEERQGTLIASPEEIAMENHWISPEDVLKISELYGKNDYGKALANTAKEYMMKRMENFYAGA
jgi:glucose-1-phosphate thymidylyltransferase